MIGAAPGVERRAPRLTLAGSLVATATLAAACAGASHGGGRPPAPARATLVLTGVRVFDGERVIERADVFVDGDKIALVGGGASAPAGAEVVDGKGRTLLPGLIDAHVHVHDAAHLEQSLAFGVTTALDMFHSSPARVKALRAEDRPGRADLRSAGILATAPGGHGTEYGTPIPTIRGPAEAQAFADARFAEGSDYLKIVLDDGRAYGLTVPTIGEGTLRSLVDAAHARSKIAVVHASDYASARAAIEGGADGLAHLFVDRRPADDFGALVAQKGAFVVPTLAVARALRHGEATIGDHPAVAPYLSDDARANLRASFRISARSEPGTIEASIAQLRDAGVPILCGSDAPNPGTAHGASVHDELGLLVEAGLTPAAALAGATSLPARRFGLIDRGKIAAGLRADLVLVEGDPTSDIADTRRIVAVWRGGVRFDRAAYRARVAASNSASAAPTDVGLISDFENGSAGTPFGRPWEESTDAELKGGSRVELVVVDEGAEASRRALAVSGEVAAGKGQTWAGVRLVPGRRRGAPVDLSAKKQITFFAKGDGQTYVALLFSKRGGRSPRVRTFQAGKDFARVAFSWADFDGFDGKDVTTIFLGRAEPGPFRLVLDDVALR